MYTTYMYNPINLNKPLSTTTQLTIHNPFYIEFKRLNAELMEVEDTFAKQKDRREKYEQYETCANMKNVDKAELFLMILERNRPKFEAHANEWQSFKRASEKSMR